MAFDLDIPLVKGGTQTITINESKSTRTFKFKTVFMATLDDDNSLYANFVKKGTAPWTGTDSVTAIVMIAKRLNADSVYLQDASHIWCKDSYSGYNLTFRSILDTGKTWYERQGFEVMDDAYTSKSDIRKLRKLTDVWVPKFKNILVKNISQSVRDQLNSVGTKSLPVIGAFGQKERSQDFKFVIKHRKKLLTLLESAKPRTLGTWLPTLDCFDYAFFMWAMYGHWYMKNPAVASINGVTTPSVTVFTKANALINKPLNWILKLPHQS